MDTETPLVLCSDYDEKTMCGRWVGICESGGYIIDDLHGKTITVRRIALYDPTLLGYPWGATLMILVSKGRRP